MMRAQVNIRKRRAIGNQLQYISNEVKITEMITQEKNPQICYQHSKDAMNKTL